MKAYSNRNWLVGPLVVLTLSLTACGSASKADKGAAAAKKPNQTTFDAANFVDPTKSTNKYHPLRPGTQWVRAGTTEVGSRKVPHQVISTMTDVVRTIDGVKVVAMLDQSTDSGEVAQVGFDWFGLDKFSNVWIMGGYTEDYEGGRFTNVEDTWLGKGAGGKPGILMPGHVTLSTPRWFIGSTGPDSRGSVAEPAKIGVSRCVKFGCYKDVLVTREGEYGAIDNELKYYAPEIGVIDNVPQGASLHQDTFQLRNLVQLSAAGLADASQIVLDLEAHARKTAPKVYKSASIARRLS